MIFINIIIFFSILFFSLSQKIYERNRLQLNKLFSLQLEKSYLFVISFSNHKKFDKLHFFFTIIDNTYFNKLRYSFTESEQEPKDIEIPISTQQISKYKKINSYYYFDIEIPEDSKYKQVIFLLDDITSNGYFSQNKFDESEIILISNYEEKKFTLNGPLLLVANISEINSYSFKFTTKSFLFNEFNLNILYKESECSDYIIFPNEFNTCIPFNISLNGIDTYYFKNKTKNIKLIFLIFNSSINGELTFQFTEKYDLETEINFVHSTKDIDVTPKSKIVLVDYEIDQSYFYLNYYFTIKYTKDLNILDIYYSYSKKGYKEIEYNMYARKLICTQKIKKDNDTIYNYCSIQKTNCSSLILIIFIDGNKTFNIKQNSEDISSYSIIPYFSSKKFEFDDMRDSKLIAIGNRDLNHPFYLKIILNSNYRSLIIYSVNNIDVEEYYEIPNLDFPKNVKQIYLEDTLYSYFIIDNTFKIGVKSLFLEISRDNGNAIVETTKYNESPDRIYNMKKKEKFTIINYEYKNLYISFDIREFDIINDIIYFQFRGDENTFNSNNIYYSFNEQEYTEEDIELEYNISTKCKKKYNQKIDEIIYYCNYTRKEKDKLSLKFI